MFCRSFCAFCLTFVNALIWSRRRAKHWRRCFRNYQKRSKTLARFHHDRFSFFDEEEESRKKLFARESRSRVEFEVRTRIKARARVLLRKEEEEEKKNEKKEKRKEKEEKNVEQTIAFRQLQVQISIKKISSRDRFFKQKK
jgi:transposase